MAEAVDPEHQLIERGLSSLRIDVTWTQVQQLLELAQLLERWSGRMNLTGHRDRDAILRRLVLESAALCGSLPTTSSVVDLGSGAGFPGLPIAILRPRCSVTLVESRERRHHFQRTAIRTLGLENVEALRARIEDRPRPHGLVTAQALASADRALELMVPWAERGGWIALPGTDVRQRITHHPDLEFVVSRAYQSPAGGPRRFVWLGRRFR
jgi:16S rRNA (guanine527-N7)-methyltransferase